MVCFKKNFLFWVAMAMICLIFNGCRQIKQSKNQVSALSTIFPIGEKITNTNFTGNVYLYNLIAADSINPTAVGNVTFEPRARTKWHIHPGGQIILAVDGEGYYQEKGQPKRTLKKGDAIKCPPNIPHWHGASPHQHFVQVALTNRHLGETIWLNEVTEEEYAH